MELKWSLMEKMDNFWLFFNLKIYCSQTINRNKIGSGFFVLLNKWKSSILNSSLRQWKSNKNIYTRKKCIQKERKETKNTYTFVFLYCEEEYKVRGKNYISDQFHSEKSYVTRTEWMEFSSLQHLYIYDNG